jgi:hypothetical protein
VEVIAAAVSFVRVLVEANQQDELQKRAGSFTVIAKVDGFDDTRCQVLDLLRSEEIETAPLEEALGYHRVKEQIGNRFPDPALRSIVTSTLLGMTERNYIATVRSRLEDPDWAKWHLPVALADAERLLEIHPLDDRSEALFREWTIQIPSFQRLTERGHLLGCDILTQCWKCCSPAAPPGSYQKLVTRLGEAPERLFDIVRAAARFLYYDIESRLLATSTSERTGGRQVTDSQGEIPPQQEKSQQTDTPSTGCHAPNDTPPPGFPPHCVTAPPGRIRRALHHTEGLSDNPQTLNQLEHLGAIAIVRVAKCRKILVYFRDETLCNRVRNWLKDHRQEKKKPRGPQAKRKQDTQEPS